MKHQTLFTTASCLAALLVITTSPEALAKKKAATAPEASASPTTSASSATSPGAKTVRAVPFHGMVSAVDAKAKTFTITGKGTSRVFKISDQTAITKTGAPATIKDVVENEEVRGSYWKETDGSLMAKTVKVGPLTAQEKAAEDARKAKKAEKKAAKAAAAAASSSASPAASAAASPKP